ncbi:MAG: methylated-DNA--[protein]-cysteine S-methyltransferase [Dehalococcoidia bacterium]|nr:MAG: methylated-DNA--[protein]-cysteine S-methyltransferase [Dehalococcoidia bacterium]
MVIGWSERGICFVSLPQLSLEDAVVGLEDSQQCPVEGRSLLGDLPLRLQRYFEGEAVSFPDKLDLSNTTVFDKAVWDAARAIPYGETRSYAWLAERIGKPRAYRAVGGAMSRNRFPIIVPCHRVTASTGRLGGFGGGLELKRRLLKLESG